MVIDGCAYVGGPPPRTRVGRQPAAPQDPDPAAGQPEGANRRGDERRDAPAPSPGNVPNPQPPNRIIVARPASADYEQIQQLLDHLQASQRRLHDVVEREIQEGREERERMDLERMEQRIERAREELLALRARLRDLPQGVREHFEAMIDQALQSAQAIGQAIPEDATGQVNLPELEQGLDRLDEQIREMDEAAQEQEELMDAARPYPELYAALEEMGPSEAPSARFIEDLIAMDNQLPEGARILSGPNALNRAQVGRLLRMRRQYAFCLGMGQERRTALPEQADRSLIALISASRSGGGLTEAEINSIFEQEEIGIRFNRHSFAYIFTGNPNGAGTEHCGIGGLVLGFEALFNTAILINDRELTLEQMEENPEQLNQFNNEFQAFAERYARQEEFCLVEPGDQRMIGQVLARQMVRPERLPTDAEVERYIANHRGVSREDAYHQLLLDRFLVELGGPNSRYAEIADQIRAMQRRGASVNEQWDALMLHLNRGLLHTQSNTAGNRRQSDARQRMRHTARFARLMFSVTEDAREDAARLNGDRPERVNFDGVGYAHIVELERVIRTGGQYNIQGVLEDPESFVPNGIDIDGQGRESLAPNREDEEAQ